MNIKRLSELLERCTPAPWSLTTRPDGTMVILTRYPSGGCRKHIAEMAWADGEGGEPDAELIALAPQLAADVVRLTEALRKTNEVLGDCKNLTWSDIAVRLSDNNELLSSIGGGEE